MQKRIKTKRQLARALLNEAYRGNNRKMIDYLGKKEGKPNAKED